MPAKKAAILTFEARWDPSFSSSSAPWVSFVPLLSFDRLAPEMVASMGSSEREQKRYAHGSFEYRGWPWRVRLLRTKRELSKGRMNHIPEGIGNILVQFFNFTSISNSFDKTTDLNEWYTFLTYVVIDSCLECFLLCSFLCFDVLSYALLQ